MIIFDEKLFAEEMIKKGFKTTHKHVNELGILAKYYYSLRKEKDEIKEKLKEFCEKHIAQYNNDEWYKVINRTIDVAKNKKLITGKVVNITKKELSTIKELDKLNEQKVAFVLLVLYKFYDQRKFEINIEDLYRLCKINSQINSQTKLKILQNLTKQGLIDISMNGERWVTFADNDDKTIIELTDFEDFIYEFSYYVGEKNYSKCSICTKGIKITNNRKKYCKICWNEKERERKRKAWHKMKNK